MSIETIENTNTQLAELQARWKSHNNHSSIEHAQHILLYALMKTNMLESTSPNFNAIGLKVLARLKKAFPPIIRPSKLNNGRKPYDTLQHLLWVMYSSRSNFILGMQLSEVAANNMKQLAKWLYDELRMERKD